MTLKNEYRPKNEEELETENIVLEYYLYIKILLMEDAETFSLYSVLHN